MTQKVIHETLALLEAERAALVAGNYAALADMRGRKEACLAALDSMRGSTELARVALAAQRNERLLAAALAGLKTALDRVTTIRASLADHGTYDATGRKSRLAAPPGALQRKA